MCNLRKEMKTFSGQENRGIKKDFIIWLVLSKYRNLYSISEASNTQEDFFLERRDRQVMILTDEWLCIFHIYVHFIYQCTCYGYKDPVHYRVIFQRKWYCPNFFWIHTFCLFFYTNAQFHIGKVISVTSNSPLLFF